MAGSGSAAEIELQIRIQGLVDRLIKTTVPGPGAVAYGADRLRLHELRLELGPGEMKQVGDVPTLQTTDMVQIHSLGRKPLPAVHAGVSFLQLVDEALVLLPPIGHCSSLLTL